MGDWAIIITGQGPHHNGKADIDADMAADEFVAKLLEMGQNVKHAEFVSGGSLRLATQRPALAPPQARAEGQEAAEPIPHVVFVKEYPLAPEHVDVYYCPEIKGHYHTSKRNHAGNCLACNAAVEPQQQGEPTRKQILYGDWPEEPRQQSARDD